MSFERLPETIIYSILWYVDFQDLCSISERPIWEELWLDLCRRTWGEEVPTESKVNVSWKNIYRAKYKQRRFASIPPEFFLETMKIVGSIAKEIDSSREPPAFSSDLAELLLSRAIPIKYLGYLRSQVTNLRLKSLILSETIVQTFIEDLTINLKDSYEPKFLFLRFLNNIFAKTSESLVYYDLNLKPRIEKKFPLCFAPNEKSLYQLLNAAILFQISRSLQRHTGVEFTTQAHSKLMRKLDSKRSVNPNASLSNSLFLESNSPDLLDLSDIVEKSWSLLPAKLKIPIEGLTPSNSPQVPMRESQRQEIKNSKEEKAVAKPVEKSSIDEEIRVLPPDLTSDLEWCKIEERDPEEPAVPLKPAEEVKWFSKRISVAATNLKNTMKKSIKELLHEN